MGGQPSAEQKTTITNKVNNEINVRITNHNENITKTLNSTVNDTSNTMIAQHTSNTSSTVGGSNSASGTLTIKGNNNKIDLNQKVSVSAQIASAQKITTDITLMNQLIANASNDIQNKVKTDSSVQADIKASAALNNIKKDGGGLEGIVNNVLSSLTSLVGQGPPPSNTTVDSVINTCINTAISNTTINETDTKTIVENYMKNIVDASATITCKQITTGSNSINQDINVLGDNNIGGIDQSNDVTGLGSCIQTAVNTEHLTSLLSAVAVTKTTNDTANTNTASTKSDTKAKTENIDQKDATLVKDIGDSAAKVLKAPGEGIGAALGGAFGGSGGGMYMGIMLSLCCVCCIGGFAFTTMQSNQGSDNNDSYDENNDSYDENNDSYDDDYEQYGGEIQNIIFKIISKIGLNLLLLLFLLFLIFTKK